MHTITPHRLARTIRFAACLLSLAVIGITPPAFAAEGVTSAGTKRFAAVTRIRGDVIALNPSTNAERKLQAGDPVFVGEKIRAASAAEAVLKTEDAGFVAVRPNTEFIAESFAAEGKTSDNMTVRLTNGSLRVISGWIGKVNKNEHKVVTNTATIGIRGTDHEPYVLSAELARSTGNKEGTYDKVNRGGTSLEANGSSVDIDPGKVGFAPKQFKQRALLTLMLPVLLDKVPEFYVPGEFDGELDQLSESADTEAAKLLEQKQSSNTIKPPTDCVSGSVAKKWLEQLDKGIVQRNSSLILPLFAPDASIKASVRTQDGSLAGVTMSRDEFAQSTTTATAQLQEFKQRRISVDAKPVDSKTVCGPIKIKSVVIEQGKQSGKPYRFESTEEFVLEWRDGAWLATQAEATQR